MQNEIYRQDLCAGDKVSFCIVCEARSLNWRSEVVTTSLFNSELMEVVVVEAALARLRETRRVSMAMCLPYHDANGTVGV